MARLKPREIAVAVLADDARTRDYVENRFESVLAQSPVTAPDRAFAQELVYGVVRWQATLDWLIARKTKGRTQKVLLQVLLRLGLYQMFWLDRVPGYAAVNETVEFAKQHNLKPQAGFLNAVLRAYARERQATQQLLAELKTTRPDLGYSHPQWLCGRWQQRWGAENLLRLLAWNNVPPPTYARLNTLRADAAALTTLWQREGVQYKARQWDWTGDDLIYEFLEHPPLAQMPSFSQGWFYLQDPSTLLAVRELNPQPGDRLLDLCAAPGGKATFSAQLMQDRGQIVACDAQPRRLQQLKDNCARLGIHCIIPRPLPPLAPVGLQDDPGADSSLALGSASFSPPTQEAPSGATEARDEGEIFDRALVDAPCSNSGVMRRRVELRWRLRPEELGRLALMQGQLLGRAAVRLRPGGTLVYSTCSLEAEENSLVVERFLAEHREFRLEHERQLLPFTDGVDGAYVARLKKA